MESEYLTTGAAADMIGVSSTTLLTWMTAGYVAPAFRTAGGHYRWEPEAIEHLKQQLRDGTLNTK